MKRRAVHFCFAMLSAAGATLGIGCLDSSKDGPQDVDASIVPRESGASTGGNDRDGALAPTPDSNVSTPSDATLPAEPYADAQSIDAVSVVDGPASNDASIDAMTIPDGGGVLTSFTVASDSLQVDKVGRGDNALAPNSEKDGVFDVTLIGSASALVIQLTDANGVRNGQEQWDTLVGTTPMPAGLSTAWTKGSDTWVLGVYESDVLVNNVDGSIPAYGPGEHHFKVYMTASGSQFQTGNYFRLFAVLPIGGVAASPVVRYP